MPYNSQTGTIDDEPKTRTLRRPCGCIRPQWFSEGSPAAGEFENRVSHRTCRKHGRKVVAE